VRSSTLCHRARRSRSGLCVIAQELNEQSAHQFRLLLLHPMSGAIEKMEADHMRAGAIAHLVDSTRCLIDAPIAFASDVLRGHIYGATRKGVHLGETSGIGAAPHAIALQRAGETGPAEFGRVHIDLDFGQPLAALRADYDLDYLGDDHVAQLFALLLP